MLIIAIAGGTASGKTTIAKNIIEILNSNKVSLISMDSYYVDLSHLSFEERKKFNFDHPNSIDWDLLYTHLDSLISGKPIKKPIYSFTEYTRKEKFELVYPNSVVILEGLFALYDERIRKMSKIKIFVEAPDDIRLIRRIYRDIKERGRDIDDIIEQYVNFVRPMYVEFIEPTKKYADIIIQNEKNFKAAIELLTALAERHIIWT